MTERICIVGLDPAEHQEIQRRLGLPVVAHEVIPRMCVRDGQLLVAARNRAAMLPVSRVVFHGIFEDDLDFISGLALWGGPCLPSAAAMMDARLKFACLVRALRYSRFGAPRRDYAGPGVELRYADERVAKWGNWHCGENKERFSGEWTAREASVVEPFLPGQSVRVVLIGQRAWQIRLEGQSWLKSIHDDRAAFMELDPELLEDTRAVGRGFGLELLANDYIVTEQGARHLLEVNHIPNVTRFPEIWEAYRDFVVEWAASPV